MLPLIITFKDTNTPGKFKGNHINDFNITVVSNCGEQEKDKAQTNINQTDEIEGEIIEPSDTSNESTTSDAKTVNQRIINLHDKSKYFENVGTLILKETLNLDLFCWFKVGELFSSGASNGFVSKIDAISSTDKSLILLHKL